MESCISCGEEIEKPSGTEDITFEHKFCKKCAAEFAQTADPSDSNSINPSKGLMPAEINDGDIVSWNPKTKSGKTSKTKS